MFDKSTPTGEIVANLAFTANQQVFYLGQEKDTHYFLFSENDKCGLIGIHTYPTRLPFGNLPSSLKLSYSPPSKELCKVAMDYISGKLVVEYLGSSKEPMFKLTSVAGSETDQRCYDEFLITQKTHSKQSSDPNPGRGRGRGDVFGRDEIPEKKGQSERVRRESEPSDSSLRSRGQHKVLADSKVELIAGRRVPST